MFIASCNANARADAERGTIDIPQRSALRAGSFDGCGWRRRSHLFDLLNELPNLTALAWADVEEADTHDVRAVNRLNHAGQPERHPFEMKLRFYPGVDAEGKFLVASNAATAETQVEDGSVQHRAAFDENEVRLSIDQVPRVGSTLRQRGFSLGGALSRTSRFHTRLRLVHGAEEKERYSEP